MSCARNDGVSAIGSISLGNLSDSSNGIRGILDRFTMNATNSRRNALGDASKSSGDVSC